MRRSRTLLRLSARILFSEQQGIAVETCNGSTIRLQRPTTAPATSAFFSTAAAAAAPSTSTTPPSATTAVPSTNKRKKLKDPITITPGAAERLHNLLSSPNGQTALGIRLGVKRRGCNGLSYTMNYAQEIDPKDTKVEAHGVVVYIEPMALFNVVGTVMDWEETDLSSEFTFENPNSKGECGCGESFNV